MSQKANRKIAKRMASVTSMFSKESKGVLTEMYVMDIEEKGLESNILAHIITLAAFKKKVEDFSRFKKMLFGWRLARMVSALKNHPDLKELAKQIKKR